jgi:hypothetical protein
MTNTLNPDVLAKSLNGYFIGRNDFVNRWGNIISSYMMLPGLRFFAPMSVVGSSGQAVDLALGNSLTNNANSLFIHTSANSVPYCIYNGTTQYHSIADNAAHDIIGNEAYISNTGLTIGMWVQSDTTPSTATRLFSKGTTTGNARAYALRRNTLNQFVFGVSNNGTTDTTVATGLTFDADVWYFIVGVFVPSTSITIYQGSSSGFISVNNTTSIPATLNNSATGLAIGAQADGTQFSDIRVSMCFLCCQSLGESIIKNLFVQSKLIYTV